MSWFYSMGAAEDGRAPTEELSCIRSRDFCSKGCRGRTRSDRRAFAYPVKVVLFYDAQVEFVNLTTVLVHRYRGLRSGDSEEGRQLLSFFRSNHCGSRRKECERCAFRCSCFASPPFVYLSFFKL